jgi:hypothetical protein
VRLRLGCNDSDSVVRDLSHGLRLLARNPGSTLLAVVALAVGIGINTAVYTGYKAMVARPLAAHDRCCRK